MKLLLRLFVGFLAILLLEPSRRYFERLRFTATERKEQDLLSRCRAWLVTIPISPFLNYDEHLTTDIDFLSLVSDATKGHIYLLHVSWKAPDNVIRLTERLLATNDEFRQLSFSKQNELIKGYLDTFMCDYRLISFTSNSYEVVHYIQRCVQRANRCVERLNDSLEKGGALLQPTSP